MLQNFLVVPWVKVNRYDDFFFFLSVMQLVQLSTFAQKRLIRYTLGVLTFSLPSTAVWEASYVWESLDSEHGIA